MAKYLDSNGITTLWNKIKSTFLTEGGGDERYSLKSHSHNTITSLGNYTPTTSDNRSNYGIYTYNIYSGTPQSYMSVIGFGYSTSKVEISGSWGDDYTGHLYWRSKSDRDVASYPWKNWVEILDTNNYSSYAASASHTHSYLPLSGGTMNNGAQIICRTNDTNSSDAYNGGIQLREYNGLATSLEKTAYNAPGITFHWSGSWAGKLYLLNDQLYWRNNVLINSGNYTSYCAPATHTHDYLPLSGGDLTGPLGINNEHEVSWNISQAEKKLRFLTTTASTPATGSPGRYYSGVSFMTAYCGFQLSVYGGTGSKDLYFRHCGDSGEKWGSWWNILNSGNYTSYTVKKDGTGASGTWGINISGSAANANTVGGLAASSFVRAYSTTNDNIDSDWGQSFKTFDPIPSGTPPEQNPNISILSIGDNYIRRKQLAFTYNNDNIYYRRRTDGGWNSWVKLVHSGNIGSQSVSYASSAGNAGNADTVDGYHVTNLKTVIRNSKYIDISSGAGWYRILDCTQYSMSFFITFYGGYNYQPPTPVTYLVSHSYSTTAISQIGKSAYYGWIQAIRAVHHDTYKFYIDVKFGVSGSNASNMVAFEVTPMDDRYSSFSLIDYTKQSDGNGDAICNTSTSFNVDYASSAGSVAWSNVSGKPSTFTPSDHSHSWSSITSKPDTFTPSSHTHTNIVSLGNKNASDLSSTYPSGLSTSGIYNNGYPFSYGCCMTSMANGGAFQIAGQWNADVTGASNYDFPTEMYIRGRRDSYDVWTTWTRVVTNRNWSSIISISTLSNSEIDSIIV